MSRCTYPTATLSFERLTTRQFKETNNGTVIYQSTLTMLEELEELEERYDGSQTSPQDQGQFTDTDTDTCRGPDENGKVPYFEPFEFDECSEQGTETDSATTDNEMATLDEDNSNGIKSTLALFNEREALQLPLSGDAPDAILCWARSLSPKTSEAAFKDFITRSFSGTPPQSVEEKDLQEWAVGYLKMFAEFDLALADYVVEFDKKGRLSTAEILYVFDFLEPFAYNLVEDDAEALMDQRDQSDTSPPKNSSKAVNIGEEYQTDKASSSLARPTFTYQQHQKQIRPRQCSDTLGQYRHYLAVAAMLDLFQEFEVPSTRQIAIAMLELTLLRKELPRQEAQALLRKYPFLLRLQDAMLMITLQLLHITPLLCSSNTSTQEMGRLR